MNMNKKLFAALAIMASSVVYADSTFKKVDADQSGMISKEEAAVLKPLAAKWDSYDSNADGMLDEAEFAKFEAAPEEAK